MGIQAICAVSLGPRLLTAPLGLQVFHCHFNSNFFPLFLEHLLSDHISLSTGSFLLGEWWLRQTGRRGTCTPELLVQLQAQPRLQAGWVQRAKSAVGFQLQCPVLFSSGGGRWGCPHGGPLGDGTTQRLCGTVAGCQRGLQSGRPECVLTLCLFPMWLWVCLFNLVGLFLIYKAGIMIMVNKRVCSS